MNIGEKLAYTIVLWVFGALLISFVFGDGPIGSIIQIVIQFGLTVFIWTRPSALKQDDKSEIRLNADIDKKSEIMQPIIKPVQEEVNEVKPIYIFIMLVFALLFLVFLLNLLN